MQKLVNAEIFFLDISKYIFSFILIIILFNHKLCLE
jgi:hypothetical protein